MTEWYEHYFDERYVAFHGELRENRLAWEDVDFLERVCGLDGPGDVLDLGCGQGRHAIPLALRGHRVWALDLSSVLLERGKEEAERRGASVVWLHRRMEDIGDLGPFDAVLSLYVAFGYYGDEGDLAVLRAVAEALKPGGWFVLGLWNILGALRGLPSTSWWEGSDAVFYERDDFDPLGGWLLIHRRLFPRQGGVEDLGLARIRCYTPYETTRLLHRAGLEPQGLFGDYRGSPFDWLRSEHQVHVARKRP